MFPNARPFAPQRPLIWRGELNASAHVPSEAPCAFLRRLGDERPFPLGAAKLASVGHRKALSRGRAPIAQQGTATPDSKQAGLWAQLRFASQRYVAAVLTPESYRRGPSPRLGVGAKVLFKNGLDSLLGYNKRTALGLRLRAMNLQFSLARRRPLRTSEAASFRQPSCLRAAWPIRNRAGHADHPGPRLGKLCSPEVDARQAGWMTDSYATLWLTPSR
jgi:hypothetical protein